MFGRDGSEVSIGLTLAHFQSVRKQPVAIDKLNSSVRLGAIERAVDFNLVTDTPSKPVDLAGFKLSRSSVICSFVHSIDAGQLFGSRGGCQVIKGRKRSIEAVMKISTDSLCLGVAQMPI